MTRGVNRDRGPRNQTATVGGAHHGHLDAGRGEARIQSGAQFGGGGIHRAIDDIGQCLRPGRRNGLPLQKGGVDRVLRIRWCIVDHVGQCGEIIHIQGVFVKNVEQGGRREGHQADLWIGGRFRFGRKALQTACRIIGPVQQHLESRDVILIILFDRFQIPTELRCDDGAEDRCGR